MRDILSCNHPYDSPKVNRTLSEVLGVLPPNYPPVWIMHKMHVQDNNIIDCL